MTILRSRPIISAMAPAAKLDGVSGVFANVSAKPRIWAERNRA